MSTPLHEASPAPTPVPTPTQVADVCAGQLVRTLAIDDEGSPIPAHLTCEAAVLAARAAIAGKVDNADIAGIEFHYLRYCTRGYYCPETNNDDGHVIVHLRGGQPDLLIQLHANEDGKIEIDEVVSFTTPTADRDIH